MVHRPVRARAAPLLLLALGACTPTDAELRITDPDGLATATQLEWIAEQFDRFTALTGPDRMGLDEIRVVPGRYEEGMTDFVMGRYLRRGGTRRVELTEEVLLGRNEDALRHELCHALDDREGFSRRYVEAFDEADHQIATTGYHVPGDHPEAEVFALLCDEGPPASFDIYGDQACGLGLEDWVYLLHDEVYLGRLDVWTEPASAALLTVGELVPLDSVMSPTLWSPFEGGLAQVTWSESGEGQELIVFDADGFYRVTLPEPWSEDALAVWPGRDGALWLVAADAIARVDDTWGVGEAQPIPESLTRSAEHAVVLDEDRVLIYADEDQGGSGRSAVYDRESGAALLELERIFQDRHGYTILDGDIWVPSGDPVYAGLYRLTEEGWSLRPGPLGRGALVSQDDALLQLWSPDYWLTEGAPVGGIALLNPDGSWTPLGEEPCAFTELPGGLIDVGERLLVFDGVDYRVGFAELSW